jgi:hypothetical protein
MKSSIRFHEECTMRTDPFHTGRFLALALLIALGLAACESPNSVIVTGTQRPAIAPASVKIYSHPPPVFEEIAMLNASSSSMFTTGGQSSVDKVIADLKVQAAKLGANGVILEGFSDSQTGSVGTGVGSTNVSPGSANSVGVGGSLGIYKKTGHGRAIFVEPESESQAQPQPQGQPQPQPQSPPEPQPPPQSQSH